MATVIDSLVVTLGLDSAEFKKGANDVEQAQEKLGKNTKREAKQRETAEKKADHAQKQRSKNLQRQGKEAIQTYKKIRNQVLSLGLAFTAGMGLTKFAEFVVGDTSQLGRIGKVAHMSARELSGWGIAAENAGGSSKEMMGEIMKASEQLSSFKLGQGSSQIETFLGFGGKKSALKDTRSYLMGVAQLLERINKNSPAQAQMLAGRMGFGFASYNVLKNGPDWLKQHIAAYSRLTGVTREQTKESQKALEQWNAMKASLENTGRMVMLNLMPAFREIMKEVKKLSLWLASHKDEVREWGIEGVKAVREFADALQHLVKILDQLEKKKKALSAANSATGGLLGFLANPVGSAFHGLEKSNKWGAAAGSWIGSVLGLGTGAGAGRASHSSHSTSSVHAETHIDNINVFTQAQDAAGLTKDIGLSIKSNPLALQANAGVN